MKNWERYLAESDYSWKDMFLMLIDEGHMHNLITEYLEIDYLNPIGANDLDDLVQYLEDKMRYD